MAAEDREDPAVDPWQAVSPANEEAPTGGEDDATAVRDAPPPAVGPSGTAVMPPVPDVGPAPPPEASRWEGRAAVPTPPQVREQLEPWAEPPRSAVVPVLVTVCVMLLLGVLALGAWLILTNRPGPVPSESPRTSSPAPTSSRPPASPSPSVSPTPSASPSASPTPSESPAPSPSASPHPSPSGTET